MDASLPALVTRLSQHWGWTPDLPPEEEELGRGLWRIAATDPQTYVEQIFGVLNLGFSVVLRPAGLARAEDPAVELLADFPVPSRDKPVILIATGGTTGGLRFAVHTVETLMAAATGYALQFPHWPLLHLSPLPLEHVGGLMPVFRALAAGGEVAFANYRDWLATPPPARVPPCVVSLVPTQLHRLLDDENGRVWLTRFSVILIGGAALDAADRAKAREMGLRLAPCYGMTETAAMVTTCSPEDFLVGVEGVGQPLPHVRVTLAYPENRIAVLGANICLGYWPEKPGFHREPFFTGDQGAWEARGHLRVVGRLDRMINTGGEKVDPAVVERRAMVVPGVIEAVAFALPDPDWGQKLVLAVAVENERAVQQAWEAVRQTERPCEVPKAVHHWFHHLPRTGTGKPSWRRIYARFDLPNLPTTHGEVE